MQRVVKCDDGTAVAIATKLLKVIDQPEEAKQVVESRHKKLTLPGDWDDPDGSWIEEVLPIVQSLWDAVGLLVCLLAVLPRGVQ